VTGIPSFDRFSLKCVWSDVESIIHHRFWGFPVSTGSFASLGYVAGNSSVDFIVVSVVSPARVLGNAKLWCTVFESKEVWSAFLVGRLLPKSILQFSPVCLKEA